MIRALSSLLALMLAAPSFGQTTQVSDLVSPCPNVFTYEPPGVEPNKWYGVVNLTTDTTLYALWLNIVLESKANILGNWVGEVTTDNNIDFKIENTKMTITPDQPLAIRFFILYKEGDPIPKLKAIRFNGKEICQVEEPVRVAIGYEDVGPEVTTLSTVRPIETTTTRNYNKPQTTQYWYQTEKPQTTTNSLFWTQTSPKTTITSTAKTQYWTEAKPTATTLRTTSVAQYWQQTTPTLKPVYWTQAKTEVKPQTTVRVPVWSYVKADNNQQKTTTVAPTTQRWSQKRVETTTQYNTHIAQNATDRPYTKVENSHQTQSRDRNRTDNSQTKYQAVNNQKTTPVNRYLTTEKSTIWPNINVAEKKNVTTKESRPNSSQHVGQTKYWPKIPLENNTRIEVKKPSGTDSTASYGWPENSQWTELQNQPYAKVSIKQPESTQTRDQDTDTPLYVRPVERPASSSTYDAKDNLDSIPHTYSGTGSGNRQVARPADSYQQTDRRQQNTDEVETRPVRLGDNSVVKQSWPGDSYQTWDTVRNGMDIPTVVDAPKYNTNTGNGRIQTVPESSLTYDKYQTSTELPAPAPNRIDIYSTPKNDDKVEYYSGGLPIFYIPNHGPQSTVEPTCGKVFLNKDKVLDPKSTTTLEGQWPWQIALYQQQTSVDFRYICGGTLVSKRHVITAAHCVTKKTGRLVNMNTLTVYLGKHNLRNSVEGVQVKFVSKIILHPEYDPTNFKTDLAILELREVVTFSDRIQPVCLWPEYQTDLKNVVGQSGSVVGWGYEVTGVAREELSLLRMTVVDQETCINSYADFFGRFTSDKTYCAGYSDRGRACNGDSGGGMVFQKGERWYIRGVVSLSVARQGEYRCDPKHYVIFTDVAKFLPWIEDNIEDYL